MESQTLGWAVIFATILGPILAVIISMEIENRRRDRSEKLAIFKTLLSARGNRIDFNFVNSINVIDAVFYENKEIISNKNKYVKLFNVHTTEWSESQYNIQTNESNVILNDLIKEIGKEIKIKPDGISDHFWVYSPQWISKYNIGQISQSEMIIEMARAQKSAAIQPSNTK